MTAARTRAEPATQRAPSATRRSRALASGAPASRPLNSRVLPSRSRQTAFVGLGANLGDARATLDAAFVALATLAETTLLAASSLYRTAPLEANGPDYLNAVVKLATGLSPTALLKALQHIEKTHGRKRSYRNAPRTLDLDLLLFGDHRLETAQLTLPHPRLHQRAFVLRPLAEIAPGQMIPGAGKVEVSLAQVSDQIVARL